MNYLFVYAQLDSGKVTGVGQRPNNSIPDLYLAVPHFEAELRRRKSGIYFHGPVDDYPHPIPEYGWTRLENGRYLDLRIEAIISNRTAAIEAQRDAIDLEPLDIGDGVQIHVGTNTDPWSTLNHLAALHTGDPSLPFDRVLLPRMIDGEVSGTHEVTTAGDLAAITYKRIKRHNAIHNARHQAQAEQGTLNNALRAAHLNWTRATDDNRKMRETALLNAHAATVAFDFDARLRHFTQPQFQLATVAAVLAVRQRQAIAGLQSSVAARLSSLTGRRQLWNALLETTRTLFQATTLVDIFNTAVAHIGMQTTVEGVNSLTKQAVRAIAEWEFPLSLRLTRQMGLHFALTVSREAWVSVSANHDVTFTENFPRQTGDLITLPFMAIIPDAVATGTTIKVVATASLTEQGELLETETVEFDAP